MVKIIRLRSSRRRSSSSNNSQNNNFNFQGTATTTNNNNSPSSRPLRSISNLSPESTIPEPNTGTTDISNTSTTTNRASKVLHFFESPRRAMRRRKNSNDINNNNEQGSTKTYTKLDNDDTSYLKQGYDEMNHQPTNGDDVDMSYSMEDQPLSFKTPNVMHWLNNEAPQDIIPKVISFLGPKKHQILSRVNKSWRNICLSEGVFRTLCEDYGKWEADQHGDASMIVCDGSSDDAMDIDEEGSNEDEARATTTRPNEVSNGGNYWRNFYTNNPIIPLDYPRIQDAVTALGTYHEQLRIHEFHKSVRILLQPGVHILDNTIRVHIYGDAVFSVEKLQKQHPKRWSLSSSTSSRMNDSSGMTNWNIGMDNQLTPNRRQMRQCGNFRNIFACRSIAGTSSDSMTDMEGSESPISTSTSFSTSSSTNNSKLCEQAIIAIKTRILNSPVFHVTQGTLKVSNIGIVHNCNGIDIWNGNTVVQIQPLSLNDRLLTPKPGDKMPSAIIEQSNLTSVSGRGVVAIDGGHANIRKCLIVNCAATGIYVGGPGSSAIVKDSDIVYNGSGNDRNPRRGVSRGHSGVYLEQGVATLSNCNISNNSLTGISAVSPSNATLIVKDSDLIGNGTVQLEMPPVGSVSRERSVSDNNVILDTGVGHSRSSSGSNEQQEDSNGNNANHNNNGGEMMFNGRMVLEAVERRFMFPGGNNVALNYQQPPSIPLF